jgi:hypothetical protein
MCGKAPVNSAGRDISDLVYDDEVMPVEHQLLGRGKRRKIYFEMERVGELEF